MYLPFPTMPNNYYFLFDRNTLISTHDTCNLKLNITFWIHFQFHLRPNSSITVGLLL